MSALLVPSTLRFPLVPFECPAVLKAQGQAAREGHFPDDARFRLQRGADLDDPIVMTVRTLTIVLLLRNVSIPRVRETLTTDNSENNLARTTSRRLRVSAGM